MADLDELVKKCRKSPVKMRPVLPMGQPLSVGMVGYLDQHAFRYLGSVETILGEPTGKLLSGEGLPSVEVLSGKDVSISSYAKGQTSQAFGDFAKAKARVELTFSSGKSFLIAAQDLRIKTMTEPHVLLAAMLRAYSIGLWRKHYCLIYQIAWASSFRAVLSHQPGAKLLLSLAGELGDGPASLGSLAAKASYERQSGQLEQLITNKSVPAFFNAYRIKDRFFSGSAVEVAATVPAGSSLKDVQAALGRSNPFERV